MRVCQDALVVGSLSSPQEVIFLGTILINASVPPASCGARA